MKHSISLMIPVFNGESTLRELALRAHEVLGGIAGAYEILFIDDGSRDQSWDVIRGLAREHTCVRGIRLSRNSGQQNALLCGLREARYEVSVTMDDDLQHPPEEIPRLISRLDEGYDVVYGVPEEARHSLWRKVASWGTKQFLRHVMGIQEAGSISAFRAFHTDLRRAFAHYASAWTSIDVLLSWGSDRFAAIQVRHDPRQNETSRYTLKALIQHGINLLVGFSVAPLRAASVLGFAATSFGLFVFMFVVVRYLLYGGQVPGFTFLASLIALLSGVQLFALGLISEYIARIHSRAMDRPPYLIASRTYD